LCGKRLHPNANTEMPIELEGLARWPTKSQVPSCSPILHLPHGSLKILLVGLRDVDWTAAILREHRASISPGLLGSRRPWRFLLAHHIHDSVTCLLVQTLRRKRRSSAWEAFCKSNGPLYATILGEDGRDDSKATESFRKCICWITTDIGR
jgi:hypothetical protein